MKDSHQHKPCLKNWYQGEYCEVICLAYKLILLIDILSLFVEKSHRIPSDLETRIAHRPKDTVTFGFVGHKSILTGSERLAPQSKIYSVIAKKTKNWHIFRVPEV